MNQNKIFARKVIYICIIIGLLIPLSLISRPATRGKDDQVKDHGGVLSILRDDLNLSQAKLSEIDPGSETMKLASLGLRGIAVNLLWMQAIDAKEKKDWDTFSSTLNSLVKIQPNFIRVWEFQGHNLAYNVSVEFDDYEHRYHWIKKGISFLTRGIDYNRRDHRILDNLGLFCGHKFGEADERYQYRRLFRNDSLFHDEMGAFVNIDQINTPFDPDHWLLAYQWYDRMQNMVEVGVDGTPVRKYKRDMIFYQFKPAQLRNMGMSMHREFRSGEFAKSNWARAHDEWMEYGNRPIRAMGLGLDVSLEGMMNSMKEVQDWRAELDELVPGVRTELVGKSIEQLTPEEQSLMTQPVDSLDDEQLETVRRIEKLLFGQSGNIDYQISQRSEIEDRREAEALVDKISQQLISQELSEQFRNTINYQHWKYQTMVEATDRGIAARQAEYDASELKRRSIFDSYVERDPISGEETELPGAIQKYNEAFNIWADVIKEYPTLKRGALMDDLVDVIKQYMVVRQAAGLEAWPEDFPLQYVIDHRAGLPAVIDDLPTSKDVAEMLETMDLQSRFRFPQRPNIDFSLEEDAAEKPGGDGEDGNNSKPDDQN